MGISIFWMVCFLGIQALAAPNLPVTQGSSGLTQNNTSGLTQNMLRSDTSTATDTSVGKSPAAPGVLYPGISLPQLPQSLTVGTTSAPVANPPADAAPAPEMTPSPPKFQNSNAPLGVETTPLGGSEFPSGSQLPSGGQLPSSNGPMTETPSNK